VESPLQPNSLIIGIFEFVILIFSLSCHECAHAWMASRLGDQTARLQGRVTLNPMYHIDPIGTLLFPAIAIFGPALGMGMLRGMLVGWAKPTPVISRNFQKIRRDENLVTLAGPASNLLIALVSFLALVVSAQLIPDGRKIVLLSFISAVQPLEDFTPQPLILLFALAIVINVSLFVFNLIPIPPLDGSHLLRNILPYNAVQAYDRIPIWISYLLMIFLGGYIIQAFLVPAIRVVIWALAPA
jgi:Zn-dependent protease